MAAWLTLLTYHSAPLRDRPIEWYVSCSLELVPLNGLKVPSTICIVFSGRLLKKKSISEESAWSSVTTSAISTTMAFL